MTRASAPRNRSGAPAKKAAAAAKPAAKKPPARKTPAKKSAAKKAPAKKSPAPRKAPVKKPVARKAPAKKTPAPAKAPATVPGTSEAVIDDPVSVDEPLEISDDEVEALTRWIPPTVQAGVERLVKSLAISTKPRKLALASMAVGLAKTLDDGAGLAAAAVTRELRLCLQELVEGEEHKSRELEELEGDLATAE